MNRQATFAAEQENRIWFRAISEHIYLTSGIYLHGENRSIYLRRVNDMLERSGCRNLEAFYHRLRFHPEGRELTQRLIEMITTGETYFFRESRQLDFFMAKLLGPHIRSANRLPLQIWSAGCSTGDEPYTLAMMALSRGLTADQVQILGGDINYRALDVARQGFYRPSAFRVAAPEAQSVYFAAQSDGRFSIQERVRALVEFTWLNLMDGDMLQLLPKPDYIFCRNVLIYFDKEAKKRAVANLYNCLEPGGVLFFGHAESLLNLENDFIPEQQDGEIFYRKPPQ